MKYIWTIIAGLVQIIIAISLFGGYYSDFEIVVIALLVLVYMSVVSFSSGSGIVRVNQLAFINDQFIKIRKAITPRITTSENEEEEREELLKMIRTAEAKFYIGTVANSIVYIIAVYHLLVAL